MKKYECPETTGRLGEFPEVLLKGEVSPTLRSIILLNWSVCATSIPNVLYKQSFQFLYSLRLLMNKILRFRRILSEIIQLHRW